MTARLPREVTESGRGAQRSNVASPETFVGSLTPSAAARRSFDAAFLVNFSPDGMSRITRIHGDDAGLINLDNADRTRSVAVLSEKLAGIAAVPEYFADITDPPA